LDPVNSILPTLRTVQRRFGCRMSLVEIPWMGMDRDDAIFGTIFAVNREITRKA
jgi:hypothetical protein